MSALHAAFVAAQAEMPELYKDSEAEVQTKSGGKFKYTYLSLGPLLEQVRPVLNKHGLGLYQVPSDRDGRLGLLSVILHADGETLEAWTPLAVDGNASAQAQGSAITYARRYAVLSMLGLAPDEDDDGAKASRNRQGSSERDEARVPSSSNQGPDGGNPARSEGSSGDGLSEGDGTHGEASLLTGAAAAADSSSSESSFVPPEPAAKRPVSKGTLGLLKAHVESLQKGFPSPDPTHKYWEDVQSFMYAEFGKAKTAELTEAEAQQVVREFENRLLKAQHNQDVPIA